MVKHAVCAPVASLAQGYRLRARNCQERRRGLIPCARFRDDGFLEYMMVPWSLPLAIELRHCGPAEGSEHPPRTECRLAAAPLASSALGLPHLQCERCVRYRPSVPPKLLQCFLGIYANTKQPSRIHIALREYKTAFAALTRGLLIS